ncbi:MAG: LptF/LptG family permease [Phycisphaerales bacterium]|nr:LptF/LptG family permease [Phycisphaerales bacterium]
MRTLTRSIVIRMVKNFVILFVLLFVLGSMIDLIVNLEEFDKAATQMSEGKGFFARIYSIFFVAFGFEGPRIFQVFAYFHGLIAIGAMGFTASQMWKSREFIAMMAAGISLRTVAMPFIVVTICISGVALLNQELMLPKVAPLLLRSHSEVGSESVEAFPVPFTPDKNKTLLIASSLDPVTGDLLYPTFLIRNDTGQMVGRVYATSGTWDETRQGWLLENGKSSEISTEDALHNRVSAFAPVDVEFFETDLSPHLLTLHRYGQYLGLLGISQLNQMLETVGTFDRAQLSRHWYSRFSTIAMNILAMFIVIPFFVTKDQISIVRQSLWCAAVAIAILFGGSFLMLMAFSGIPSVVSVFLPALLLIPVAFVRMTALHT